MKRVQMIIGVVILSFFSATVLATPSKTYTPDSNAPRSSVPSAYKWKLAPLAGSDGAWEGMYRQAKKQISALPHHKGKLSTASGLSACLTDYFSLRSILDRVSMYANLKHDQDVEVERYQKMNQRSVTLMKSFQQNASFMRQELLAMDASTLSTLLADTSLKPYRAYVQNMTRRAGRMKGPEAEEVLGIVGDNLFSETDLNEIPSDIELVFKATMRDLQLPMVTDEKGKRIQLTLSNYGKYRASKDRRVRRETVEGFFGALRKYQNILAATLGGEVKRDVTLAKVRDYDRAIDAYLDRENVDPKVVDTMIRAINANLKPLHRYVALRKRLLGVKDLHLYDLYTPLVPSVSTTIRYDDAVGDILTSLKPMGKAYLGKLSEGIQPGSGWADVYPNKGKESGAFSASFWGTHPYVKTNYQNDIDDAFTTTHEFGHAMHSALNMKTQSAVNFGYSSFLAEIASTFNEAMLTDYLLKKYENDDAMSLYLLGNQLESIRTTIYRQALFAEFEKKIHEYAEAGTPLTAELFNTTYRDLVRRYYGSGFTIGSDDEIEWAYIPHFYWKYYVFTYATGLASGIALSEKVRTEGKPALDRYLAMLQSPVTANPVEVLRKAGIDPLKPDAIRAAARLMSETITKIERIVARQKKKRLQTAQYSK